MPTISAALTTVNIAASCSLARASDSLVCPPALRPDLAEVAARSGRAFLLGRVEAWCRRHVSAHLEIEVHEPLEMVLQLAVPDMPGTSRRESLAITRDGEFLAATEVVIPGEGRSHVLAGRPRPVVGGCPGRLAG